MLEIKGVDPDDVLQMDLTALRRLHPEDIMVRDITEAEIRHIFEVCDALWLHSGKASAPHAELTSGRCSNGFVDVLRVLRYSNLCEVFGGQLLRRIQGQYSGAIDWVIGSDHAGATLSFAVAAQMFAQHDFTEKGPDRGQLWKRFAINPGEVVLQVEELVTTTGTLEAVRRGIRQGNPHDVTFAPLTATLIHRSDVNEFEGAPIVYLAHYDIKTWDPSECPLCAGGSSRLRPKQHWAELTGKI